MLECKDGDETIDIQMTNEVFKAEWIPLVSDIIKLISFTFR